jgi:quinol monooxygenase YgiN
MNTTTESDRSTDLQTPAIDRAAPVAFTTTGLHPSPAGIPDKGLVAMVTASVRFRLQPHKSGEVLSAVDAILGMMRGRAACLRGRLLADVDDQTAFTLASEWLDSKSAVTFFESRQFQLFHGIRILLREDPSIVLDEVHDRVTKMMRNY